MEREIVKLAVSSQEQQRFLSAKRNLHDHSEREALTALQGESIAQRKLSEAEMERDEMIWVKEILLPTWVELISD